MRKRIPAERLTLLRNISLFASCDDKALAEIDRLVCDHHVAAGAVLTREGAVGRQSYVVVSGTAAVTIRGQKVAEVGPGDVLGEMAVLQNLPRAATVSALSPMHLLVVFYADLVHLLLTDGVSRRALVGFSERLRAADELMRDRSAGQQPAPRRRASIST
jgi:CRP/FNR family transcriptional regulator, cyclic AMP receptor protein